MAEVKNSFLSSKMNKDLDDRLVPNNQYRDALNVLVGKSEGSDVGVLQSIPGNELVGSNNNYFLTCIGRIADDVNNRIIEFSTNYEDPAPSSITKVPNDFVTKIDSANIFNSYEIILQTWDSSMIKPGQTLRFNDEYVSYQYERTYTITQVVESTKTVTLDKPVSIVISPYTSIFIGYSMRILMYSTSSSISTVLSSGSFLNFATNNAFTITGVNILEDLLFWTDNRNQPRKLNIDLALKNNVRYDTEDKISVAKYNPILPITLFEKVNVTSTSATTSASGYTMFNVSLQDMALLSVGFQLINSDYDISDYVIISSITNNGVDATISLTNASVNFITNTSLTFYAQSMTNQTDNPSWNGDSSFLRDKYVRFSYRYKFNDGEYSLMAPFTQIIYIPTQKGYFFGEDETKAYTSTVLSWMENYVNSVKLHITLPDHVNNLDSKYLIDKIDILYKESDSLNVKVLETVSISDIITTTIANNYIYQYNSQVPYKTLPQSQVIRVSDRTPVRARAQEISGNRIIYANFVATNTTPANIDYEVSINNKSKSFDSWIEYPNHTLKQNRTYQVGVILSDKFGRQSPVILSSSSQKSTVYAPFSTNTTSVKSWVGNTLNVTFKNSISSNRNEYSGEPGLYAIVSGSIPGSTDGFQVDYAYLSSQEGYLNVLNFGLTSDPTNPKNIPVIGGYLRGEYVDYVKILKINPGGGYVTDGTINFNYIGKPGLIRDIKYAYDINVLGWYSYKIVVKQQQQDYYNVYLPGMLNGYPSLQTEGSSAPYSPTVFPTTEINRIAHTVLINDNINKVPRDLTEVGPDQRQYRSSVDLFCRVNNIGTGSIDTSYNVQYFPSNKADVVSTIATTGELNFLPYDAVTNPLGTARTNFYQFDTSPLIARISTVNSVGTVADDPLAVGTQNLMIPTLSVYETSPDTSLLDIYWESTTSGYISDINEEILNGEDTIVQISSLGFSFEEEQDPTGSGTGTGSANSPFVTNIFWPISNGNPIDDSDISITVTDAGDNPLNIFTIVKYNPVLPETYYTYRIKINQSVPFLSDYNISAVYAITFNITNNSTGLSYIKTINNLNLVNNAPRITNPYIDNTTISVPVNFPSGNLFQFVGNNGCSNLSNLDTQWLITNVNPSFGTSYFAIDPNTGMLSTQPRDSGVFSVTVKLTDAFDTFNNATTPASIPTTRVINVSFDNNVIANGTAVSFGGTSQSGGYTSGTIDVWRSLWPGETISDNDISIDLFRTSSGTAYTPVQPLISYNNDFTFTFSFRDSFTPGLSLPASYIQFVGTITTNRGRVINLKTLIPGYGESPFWQIFLSQDPIDPNRREATGDPSYRPGNSSNSVNWSVKNNSNSVSWFTGLGRYGNIVIGDYINPGSTITGGFDTNNCARNGSIYTEDNVTPAFTITYGTTC